MQSIKNVVMLDKIDQTVNSRLTMKGIKVYTFEDVMAAGDSKGDLISTPIKDVNSDADDVFMLCYTAGICGKSKGVKLTHK